MEDLQPRPDQRVLTEDDYVRLTHLLGDGAAGLPGADNIRRALECSRRVDGSPAVPGLVTMNSEVFLVPGAEEHLIRLKVCYPDDADPARGRISVLSPLGASLIGRSAGQTATWRSYGRVQTASILAVLAPLHKAGGGA